jgi:hypothetical protein
MSRGGDARPRGAMRQGGAPRRGDGDAGVSRRGVASGRSGVSEGSASERSLSSSSGGSGTGAARRGGGN